MRRAILYDLDVVDNWLGTLAWYSGNTTTPAGKSILELGPGADLGVGITLLMRGAHKYSAIDVNDLVKTVPEQFYEEFFRYVERNVPDREVEMEYLRSQLNLTRAGKNDRLNYHCRDDFDLSVFSGEDIELVFSQAAFEHFDNMERTISQLSGIVREGAILIAVVDFKTHTRWIRDADPLNIYRFSDGVYELLKFRGSPNRLRPPEYMEILDHYGWGRIRLLPLAVLENDYLLKVQNTLSGRFRDPVKRMELLSAIICATKA